MVGIKNKGSCREYFKRLKILPLQSQYLVSLLPFVAENVDYFRLNSENKFISTTFKIDSFRRGPYYSGIMAFSNLPTYVKNLLQTRNSKQPWKNTCTPNLVIA